MILHKTIHRYVIRKKQGKRQVNYLNKNATQKTTSAGSYKRQWNENKLKIEIQQLLTNWYDNINKWIRRIIQFFTNVR